MLSSWATQQACLFSAVNCSAVGAMRSGWRWERDCGSILFFGASSIVSKMHESHIKTLRCEGLENVAAIVTISHPLFLDKRFWLRLIMCNAVLHTVLHEVRFSYEQIFQILKGALWGDGDIGLTKVIGKRPRINTLKICNQHSLDHLVTGLVQRRCDIFIMITCRRLCADI